MREEQKSVKGRPAGENRELLLLAGGVDWGPTAESRPAEFHRRSGGEERSNRASECLLAGG